MRHLPTLALLVVSTASGAADVRYQATPAPVAFTYTRDAFKPWNFDTGWQPAGSPLQVKFHADLHGGWAAQAPGVVRLGWHPARMMWPEGNLDAGSLSMNLGYDVLASLKFSAGGINIERPIPGVPKFEKWFEAKTEFTPFALNGGQPTSAFVGAQIPKTKLLEIPITDAIFPIPGVSGNLDLFVQAKLGTTMTGTKVWFPEAEVVSSAGFISWMVPPDALYVSKARYEAQVEFKAEIDLIPAVILRVLGKDFTIYDHTFSVGLPTQTEPWVFNEQPVQFALPQLDIAFLDGPTPALGTERKLALDFSDAEVSKSTLKTVRLHNAGKAELQGDLMLEGLGFVVGPSTSVALAPGAFADYQVQLTRPGDGSFSGTLKVATNDPSGDVLISLKGLGHAGELIEGTGPTSDNTDANLKPGCGCSGSTGAASLPLVLAIALFGFGAPRRRRQARS